MSVQPIFISHSHLDNDVCHALRDFLRAKIPDTEKGIDQESCITEAI